LELINWKTENLCKVIKKWGKQFKHNMLSFWITNTKMGSRFFKHNPAGGRRRQIPCILANPKRYFGLPQIPTKHVVKAGAGWGGAARGGVGR